MATEPDPYDFNAPMYVDLAREEGGGESSHPPLSNQLPPSSTPDAVAAAATPQAPAPQAADPWDFDAPTWTDLAASSTTPASRPSSNRSNPPPPPPPPQEAKPAAATVLPPATYRTPSPSQQQQQPVVVQPKKPASPIRAPSSPAAAAASSSSSSSQARTKSPVVRRASGSPASTAKPSLSDTHSPPVPPRATAPITTAAPVRMPSPERRHPASPKASPVRDSRQRSPTIKARRMTPAAATAAPVPRPASTSTATAILTSKESALAQPPTAVRTFMHRLRKELVGPGTAPVQHHSYLAHTTASSRRTVVVDTMASFLRPTASSWSRNQNEAAAGATSGSSVPSSSKVAHSRPPSRPAGPVRALGRSMATTKATTTASTGAGASGARARQVVKESTEERQMRLAAEAQERLKRQMRMNKAAYERNRMVGASGASAPLRSTKALTIPQSPQLSLNARRGEKHRHQEPQVEVYYKPRPPPSSSSSSATHKGPKPLTIPVAPSFATDTRAHVRRASPTYHGGAAEAFSHSHPPPLRISSGMGGMGLREYVPKAPSPRTLTVPKTPNLTTKTRAAVRKGTGMAHTTTSGDAEERDLEECRHQFKARPGDRRVLHPTGDMGVPKAMAKSGVTEPQPFHFKSSARVRRVPTSADQEGEGFAVPKDKKQGQPEGKSHDDHGPHGLVVPKPFQLATEQRGQQHKALFEARLAQEKEAEEAAHQVHAHKMPDFHRSFQPQPSARPLTEFEEFHLASVKRHEDAQSTWQREMDQLKEEERQQAQGPRARPLPASTYHPGFEVKPSEREPLFPMTMNLSTSIRAAERKAYEAERQVREVAERAEQAALQEEQQRAAARNIRRERMTPVEQGGTHFVAKPILHSSHPRRPVPSVRKLTVPISPHLRVAQRSHITRHEES